MATIESVEKLRERADVTFEEARAALDACGDDLLDALIMLERQGKANPPGGGEYSGSDSQRETRDANDDLRKAKEEYEREKAAVKKRLKTESYKTKTAFSRLGHVLLKLLEIGNNNFIDASYKGKRRMSCPFTAMALLLIFFPWAVVIVLVAGLLFGWSYRVRGAQLGRDDVNDTIAKAESAAEELRGSFGGFAEDAGDDDTDEDTDEEDDNVDAVTHGELQCQES